MTDFVSTTPIPRIQRMVRTMRVSGVSIGMALAVALAAYGKAATMLYALPFGLDATSKPRHNGIGDDSRDQSW